MPRARNFGLILLRANQRRRLCCAIRLSILARECEQIKTFVANVTLAIRKILLAFLLQRSIDQLPADFQSVIEIFLSK